MRTRPKPNRIQCTRTAIASRDVRSTAVVVAAAAVDIPRRVVVVVVVLAFVAVAWQRMEPNLVAADHVDNEEEVVTLDCLGFLETNKRREEVVSPLLSNDD